jgi:hypothetical protein
LVFDFREVEIQMAKGSTETADKVKRLESLKNECNPIQRNNIIDLRRSNFPQLGILHSLPMWIAQRISQGKVAAVKTEALKIEIDPNADCKASNKLSIRRPAWGIENFLAKVSHPVPDTIDRIKRNN